MITQAQPHESNICLDMSLQDILLPNELDIINTYLYWLSTDMVMELLFRNVDLAPHVGSIQDYIDDNTIRVVEDFYTNVEHSFNVCMDQGNTHDGDTFEYLADYALHPISRIIERILIMLLTRFQNIQYIPTRLTLRKDLPISQKPYHLVNDMYRYIYRFYLTSEKSLS